MYFFDIMQLIRCGQVHEILNILNRTVPTREDFLALTGPNLHKFIGLVACTGSIEILQHCNTKYGAEIVIGSDFGLHAIVGAASRGHDHVIKWLLEGWVRTGRLIEGRQHYDKLNIPQGWLCPSLHRAVQGHYVSTVKLLVEDAWADVNSCDDDGLKPLHVVGDSTDKNNPEQMSRYEEIVNILVTAGSRVNDFRPITHTTPLYYAVKLNSRKTTERLIDAGADVFISNLYTKITVLHVAAEDGFHETLRILLDHNSLREKNPCDFDVEDKNGNTPLHAAAYGGHWECVRILIQKGLSLTSETTSKITVMKVIFEHVPYPVIFLTEILDEHVTATDRSGNNLIIDFRFLAKKHSHDWEDHLPDMDVVVAMINGAQNMEQMAILQHPLLETFLHLKCLPSVPYEIYILFTHLVFAVIFWWQSTDIEVIINDGHFHSAPFTWFLAFHNGIENYRRTIVLCSSLKLDKLNRNLLFASCVISMISFLYEQIVVKLWPYLESVDSYYTHIRMYLCSILVLLSWINVMLLLIQFPLIGEWFFMFIAVLSKIGKVLFSFTFLIIGFSLTFSILFSGTDQFDTPWKAFVKTLVMMTGEYEYDDLFSSTGKNNSIFNNFTSAKNNTNSLQGPTMIVFLIFVIVSSIALMNLMVGLAVNDIQELLKEGRTRRLMKQANSAAAGKYFSRFMKTITARRMQLDLNGTYLFPNSLIPAKVKKGLYDLALKNYNREEQSQTKSTRKSTQEILAAMQSSLQRIVVEQQRQNNHIKRLTQDRKLKWRRRSI